MSDIPTPLLFVDPQATDDTYRVVLWASPGQGKSVAAASAPGPILVLNADRPSAYKYARKHHPDKEIREVRYTDQSTLDSVYRYLSGDGKDIRTVIVDPFSNVYDELVDSAPTVMMKGRRAPDYQSVNKKILGFVQSLRRFDINVVLVAHEKLSDDDEGKLYPSLGGPSLINKVLAEMDIAAHIERHVRTTDDGEDVVLYVGQLQPRDNLVCKESASGGALGDRRIADLSRWFEIASEAMRPDDSDVPFGLAEPTLADAINAGDIETDVAA